MSERRTTILSTSKLPFERISAVPDTVNLQIIPFIEINPIDESDVIHKIEWLSTKKAAVVFTSAEAVKIVTRILQDKKPDWNIYCIRTETSIASMGLSANPSGIRYANNASDLSSKIIADGIKEVFFFCGDQRLNILPDALKNNGVAVTEIIVYETKQTPVVISWQPDIIFFFSPSAVRSFFSINELSKNTKVFLIGTTTAETFKQYSTNPFIVSPEPDKAVVLHMALEFARTHSLHE